MENKKYIKRDRYKEVTDTIIAAMEKGALPWQAGWDEKVSAAMFGVPINGQSKKPYNYENTIYLMAKMKELKSNDTRFFTFAQANKMGYGIRKNAHGTYIKQSFYVDTDKEGQELPATEKRWVPIYSYVYNASQLCMREAVIENGETKKNAHGETIFKNTDKPIPAYEPKKNCYTHEETIEIADEILRKSGAKICQDQAKKAFYKPPTDEIHLPFREAFPDIIDYYATALHELSHWTGHKSRLNRPMGNSFGSIEYAKEELRAEMASVFLAIDLNLPINSNNHAAYTQSWLKILKNDKMEFFKAVNDARKITQYVKSITKLKKFEIEATEKIETTTRPIISGHKEGEDRKLKDEVKNSLKNGISIAIYQSGTEEAWTFRKFGEVPIDFNKYKKVYEEIIPKENINKILNDIYSQYQDNHKINMRSVAVSDIVKINDRYYYVNNIGFQEVKMNSFKDKIILTAVMSESLANLIKEQKKIVGEKKFEKYQNKFNNNYTIGATVKTENDIDVLKRYQKFIYDNAIKYGLSSVRPNDQKAWQNADYGFILSEARNTSNSLYLQLAVKTVQIYSPYVEICQKGNYAKNVSNLVLASPEYKELQCNLSHDSRSREDVIERMDGLLR